MVLHKGSCHCNKVTFEFNGPKNLKALDCNCSICSRIGYLHIIIPKNEFSLIRGKAMLTEYSFNTGKATHLFCRNCGIKSFYIPRSHPTCYSVNARCLHPKTWNSIKIESFDGLNWEAAKAKLGD